MIFCQLGCHHELYQDELCLISIEPVLSVACMRPINSYNMENFADRSEKISTLVHSFKLTAKGAIRMRWISQVYSAFSNVCVRILEI